MTAARMIVLEQWGRNVAVVVVPRTVDKPSKTFRTAAEALAFASELRRREGWSVVDRRI